MNFKYIRKIADFYASKTGEVIISQIGNGVNGVAYQTESGKVIKITLNYYEGALVKKIVGKKFQHIADYYDIKSIKSDNQVFFGITMELLNMSCDLADAINALDDFIIDVLGYSSLVDLKKISKNEFLKVLNENRDSIYVADSYVPEVIKIAGEVYDGIEELVKINKNIGDIHGGNIGYKKNGKLAFFDVMAFDPIEMNIECDYTIKEFSERLKNKILNNKDCVYRYNRTNHIKWGLNELYCSNEKQPIAYFGIKSSGFRGIEDIPRLFGGFIIKQEYRRQGIGTKILKDIFTQLKIDKIAIETVDWQGSTKFWSKIGAKVIYDNNGYKIWLLSFKDFL